MINVAEQIEWHFDPHFLHIIVGDVFSGEIKEQHEICVKLDQLMSLQNLIESNSYHDP